MKAIKLALFIVCALLAQPAFAYTLSVVNGAGVTGSPANSNKNYPPGRVVPYSYAPAAGYASVTVVVDGKIMPPKGAIKMKANRWIYAYANPLSGKLFGNMITVPSDPTKILYPQFFQNRKPTTLRVADPYCAVTSDTISYPASYLGDFPLPKIVGAPLAKGVLRGASVKDYWLYGLNDPSTNAGCKGKLHDAFIASLKRFKAMGMDHVVVWRDTAVADINAPTLTILPNAPWAISFSELKWITKTAKSLGLKVYAYQQIGDGDMKGNLLTNSPTVEWMTKFMDAYIPFIVARAKEAQATGVAGFQLDWGVWWLANLSDPTIKTMFLAKMNEAATQVRAVYSGKIIYGALNPWDGSDDTLLQKIDYLRIPFWMITFDATDNQNLNVAMLKQKYIDVINAVANSYGPNRKPAVFEVSAQSHRNYLLNGWMEDGFCTPAGNNPCKERKADIDFSVQAIAFEAALEAINEQTAFQTAGVETHSYWFVDVILGKDAFPNLSQSWRNKPAEAILRKWYRK